MIMEREPIKIMQLRRKKKDSERKNDIFHTDL